MSSWIQDRTCDSQSHSYSSQRTNCKMLEFDTPVSGGHTGLKVHRTDGATTKFGKGSPASSGGYSHYTTSFNESRSGSHADIFPQRPRLRSPYYTRMLPDCRAGTPNLTELKIHDVGVLHVTYCELRCLKPFGDHM